MTRKRYGKYVSRVGSAPKNPRKKKRYGGGVAPELPDANPAPAMPNLAGVAAPEFDDFDEDEDPDFMELLHHAHSEMRSFGEHNAMHINHGFDPQMAYVAPQNIDTKSMAEAIRDKHLGGGLNWDMVGENIGHASVFAGELGLAASGVATFLNPMAGAAMAAVSAGAVGAGMAINHAYGKPVLQST